ncbi:hypothetical protein AX15_001132 [Amanita polypyramis BW_CC]|nr:hypothetical protein AX15_001132 [Amanita polypyramis BW_CC]
MQVIHERRAGHDQVQQQDRWQERPRQQHSQQPQARHHYEYPQREHPVPVSRERTMVEQAWYSIMTTDPLADSDEEPHDEHSRLDYSKFLSIA